MNVLNNLGHGFLEKIYENSLIVEFQEKTIPYKQQARFEVTYKGKPVGLYIPDIIVYDQIVLDVKNIETIGNNEKGQMLNYLKVTGLPVGLVLNFRKPKLEWERMIL